MKTTRILYSFFIIMLFSSCFQEEEPIELPQIGTNSMTFTFEMGSDYSNRFYFDLSTGAVPTYSKITDWDLAFDNRAGSYYVWLNSSKSMFAANTGYKEFDIEPDINTLQWSIDIPSGNPDSNAIGNWADFSISNPVSYGYVYVIDLGRDENNDILGFMKMKIIACENDHYKIKIADLNGSNEAEISIKRNPLYNFTYLSLDSKTEILIEPTKTDWDLVFTRYSTAFYVPAFTPYQVTGVLSNPNHTAVAEVDNIAFEELTINDVLALNYSEEWDAIGYDWKEVDISNGSYTIFTDKVFVIKDNLGELYKLRFLDFTNSLGENGFPKIEFQKM
ncbi:MAG: hypothetical protein HKN92_01455 [Chitinophagales bacterium]|nr:hypothetical protein [Chitinophagales bacterium]